MEGAAVSGGASADEFGADGLAAGIAADKDGVAAGVGVEQALPMAEFEQLGCEAALAVQEIAHGRPEAVVGWRQAELGGGRRRGGGPGVWRQVGGVLFEEFDGLAETAAAGVHDQVDGAAAAASAAMVEEACAVDAEDRAGQFPAGAVARVAAVAELPRQRQQGGLADGVGAGAPRPGAVHGASSWQLRWRCSAETVRAWSRVAAMRA